MSRLHAANRFRPSWTSKRPTRGDISSATATIGDAFPGRVAGSVRLVADRLAVP